MAGTNSNLRSPTPLQVIKRDTKQEMATKYHWDKARASIVYEIFMPRRHKRVLKFVLDSLFTRTKFVRIPEVIEIMSRYQRESEKRRDQILGELFVACQKAISGYSMYEVQGRFFSANQSKIVDEKSVVVRLIVADLDCSVPGGGNVTVFNTAQRMIENLVVKRLAEEAPEEEEIWFVKYDHAGLQRYIQETDPAKKGA